MDYLSNNHELIIQRVYSWTIHWLQGVWQGLQRAHGVAVQRLPFAWMGKQWAPLKLLPGHH